MAHAQHWARAVRVPSRLAAAAGGGRSAVGVYCLRAPLTFGCLRAQHWARAVGVRTEPASEPGWLPLLEAGAAPLGSTASGDP